MDKLKKALKSQINLNQQSNLFFRNHELAIEVDPDFISVLEKARADKDNQFFKDNYWGTIISNAALSNHILYAAQNDSTLFNRYEILFRKILNSLKQDGSLILAPGNLIVNSEIDSHRFHIEQRPVAKELFVTTITRIAL